MNNLFSVWGDSKEYIVGDKDVVKPGLCCFNNIIDACEMLHKHIKNNGNILTHCDVDVDGIGSGYITKRFIESQCTSKTLYIINKDKKHGVQQKQADYFKGTNIDLLIIVDSSSNEIDIVEQFNCDVLIIDHHDVDHNRTSGKTNDGHDWILVNNTLSGTDEKLVNEWLHRNNPNTVENAGSYKATDDMSCGLTCYELYRVYCEAYGMRNYLENMLLFQWSAVTLFTDTISLTNDRNQWYIANTVANFNIEPCLSILMQQLNRYQSVLDKSFISFTLAPVLNKTIRAGAGKDALNTVLNNPYMVNDLRVYGDMQASAIDTGILSPEVGDTYVIKDLTGLGISPNYCGVIASRLSGDYKKHALVYMVEDGMAKGSFRVSSLASKEINARDFISSHKEGNYAQGHRGAFGFNLELDELKAILRDINSLGTFDDGVPYLTAGDFPDKLKGMHHIDDLDTFKKEGNLYRLAIGNSRVNSQEQIDIIAPLGNAELIEQRGKLYTYKVLGLTCKAFEPLTTQKIRVYAEQSNQLNLFAKNFN